MRIPLNRVVAFAGPYIATASGILAAWLVAKVNVVGIPGLDAANTATYLAAGGTAALTAGLTWLGHSKWLTGHHIEIESQAAITAAALAPATAAVAAGSGPSNVVEDPEVDTAPGDVSDAEEFASPPPDVDADGEPASRIRPDQPE